MELIIVTGLSGAGKTGTINALEDIGFYCIDNIPPLLIPTFVQLYTKSEETNKTKIAVVTDIRGREFFKGLSKALEDLKTMEFSYKLLFLDAEDEVLERRYKETRRKHPLIEETNGSVKEAIKKERDLLKLARENSDYVIDTSYTTTGKLKENLTKIFLVDSYQGMLITCVSFGFKYAPCKEADLVFDVRCIPNPFYVKNLKHKTGLDKEVYDYVFGFKQAVELNDKIVDLVDFLIPQYLKEGKSQLTIAFGCTGGKHRSVSFAQRLYNYLKQKDKKITINHRDIKL